MVIDLEFSRPLHVSQSYTPDMLLLYMNFSNMTDVNGLPLPDLDFQKKELPAQIGSVTEAQIITVAGKSASTTSGVLMSSNFAVNLALSASMNQVWSMLNSQQVSVHAPMYGGVKFPANAMMMNQALI